MAVPQTRMKQQRDMHFRGVDRFNITESMAIGKEGKQYFLLHDGDGFTKIGLILSPKGKSALHAFADGKAAKAFARENDAFIVFPGNDGFPGEVSSVYVVRLFSPSSVFKEYGQNVAFEPDRILLEDYLFGCKPTVDALNEALANYNAKIGLAPDRFVGVRELQKKIDRLRPGDQTGESSENNDIGFIIKRTDGGLKVYALA